MTEHARKIAAIVAADVVDYSRLMGADEAATLDALKIRRALFERLVRDFDGREFGSVGDSLMAQFPSAVNAVRCAQAITKRTEAIGLDVRSGVHTGEVEMRLNDLHGLAVHVAQRICSAAAAGAVLTSHTVVDLVVGSDIQFDDAGDHELKGVPGMWRLSRVTA